jgi:hypothetical protein
MNSDNPSYNGVRLALQYFVVSTAAIIAFAAPVAALADNGGTATLDQGKWDQSSYSSGGKSLHKYSTSNAAQAHCPNDAVVWLNTRTGIWHLAGERWYGRTKHGAYVCEREATAAGDRETHNGQ